MTDEELSLFIKTDYRDFLAERWPSFHVEDIVVSALSLNVSGQFIQTRSDYTLEYFPELFSQFYDEK